MAVRRIRQKWYVDFRFQHADGRTERVRKRSPIQSKAGAEEFERKLRTALLEPGRVAHREVPKFSEYASEFMRTYAVANNKPSEQASKASMLKHHLLPAFGRMRLDEIKAHPIETLKAALLAKGISRKRVNNVLACLGKMLRYAHEIELLDSVPRVRLLKIAPQKFDFLTFDEYARLIEATKADRERQAIALVVGDAGLRQGQMIALGGATWTWSLGADRAALSVARHRRRTEGWPGTQAPAHRSAGGGAEGSSALAERPSVLPNGWQSADAVGDRGCAPLQLQAGGVAGDRLALRHSFCSHLAMCGAPPKVIQELAGHSTLSMTLRYMHLAPSVLRDAISLLNPSVPGQTGHSVGNA